MGLKLLSRRKVIVKPAYQLKMAFTLFLYIVIYSVILGFIIFYPLYSAMDRPSSPEDLERISSIVLYLHKRVWVGLFIVAVLAAVHEIFASHRVVGPVYRFERMVESLIAGDYGLRIRIRKNDEFKEMESMLNNLAETLEIDKSRDIQFHADIKIRLETISAMLEAEGAAYPDDVRKLMQNLVFELNSRIVSDGSKPPARSLKQ